MSDKVKFRVWKVEVVVACMYEDCPYYDTNSGCMRCVYGKIIDPDLGKIRPMFEQALEGGDQYHVKTSKFEQFPDIITTEEELDEYDSIESFIKQKLKL